tara:strand:- start:2974 stop:4212 length:1239 start_codon:yes stop_codon:yes gene_type:complete
MLTFLLLIILVIFLFEIFLQLLIPYLKKDFQWIITEKDEIPKFDNKILSNFFTNSFDKELGWVRKPNTTGYEKTSNGKIKFQIDKNGSRELNKKFNKNLIATFGDSYTFCRQVNNNETWQSYLSQKLNAGVQNFGVGNYGLDQALLYYKRKKIDSSVKYIVMGFVPETICRIHSYWKHYLEFGNTFAFKPRYILKNNEIILLDNKISEIEDFNNLSEILSDVKRNDYFYIRKFKSRQFRFPYSLSFFKNTFLNFSLFLLILKRRVLIYFKSDTDNFSGEIFAKIMKSNIKESHNMYLNNKACDLLEMIIMNFKKEAKSRGHVPIILIMPQMFDLDYYRKNYISACELFYSKLEKKINILDIGKFIKNENLNEIYVEDLYGGHFSKKGNKIVSNILLEYINEIETLDMNIKNA